MTDLPGRLRSLLGSRYQIERELGRGGMATVYLARDLKHRRPVALKVLKPELAHALGPEGFLHEIELSARLTHPHIVPLLDSGEADGESRQALSAIRHLVARCRPGAAPRLGGGPSRAGPRDRGGMTV